MSTKQKTSKPTEKETLDNLHAAGVKIEESEPIPQPDPKTIEFQNKLTDIKTQISQSNFEKLIVLDEYTAKSGIVYKANKLPYPKIKELESLQKAAATLLGPDKEDEYVDNIRQRACILIEDMTEDKFDKEDYYLMENLVAAWGLKDRGFRDLFKSS